MQIQTLTHTNQIRTYLSNLQILIATIISMKVFNLFKFLVLINFFYQKYQSQFNGLNIDLTSFVWYSFTGNALRKHIVHEKSRRFSLNNNNVRS